MFGPGILGKMFDFNYDGKVDIFEAAAEYQYLNSIMSEDEETDEYAKFDDFDYDFSDDVW